MKDIAEFEKLFKVNLPIHEHHNYYLETLKKSPFYAGIGNIVSDYEKYEKDIEELGYKSAKSYKLDYALPKLKEYITSTQAYENILSWDYSKKLRTKDELRNNDDTYLISIDFKSANYNALKHFDTENELYSSWEDLCLNLEIHPTLSKSKSFRQYVFGNTSPKKISKVQLFFINKIVNSLIENKILEEEDFVFISHDEFIVRLRPDHKLALNRIHVLNSEVGRIISNENINIPTHYKVIKNEAIGSGMYIQTQYQVKLGGLSQKYKVLFKVPANKFYKYFKNLIINEPIDNRDLMFLSDGEIAVWKENEDSISEIIIPEGEVSLSYLKDNHPCLIKRIKDSVPSLNEAQVRKLANVFLNTCASCKNLESGCFCWNDE